MPPNNEPRSQSLLSLAECKPEEHSPQSDYRPRIIWSNVIFITLFHIIAAYTLIFQLFTFRIKVLSIAWGFFIGGLGGFGVTGGAHRLWAHRSYKAKWPLKIILLLCYSVAGQNTVYDWVRDHRVHHKFSETDADPHNSHRGFFFAHVGWLMQRKHPEVLSKGAKVDMSDILADPLVTWHTKYFTLLKLMLCFILPTIVPIYFWGEDPWRAILGMCFLRYVLGLNFTWLVNSAAHIYGNKPYDKTIRPAQNLAVAIVAMGEGWHNYHHVFPWDYKAAELGNYRVNLTTFFIDCFAKLGWAYDLKSASPSLVHSVVENRGDGSYALKKQKDEDNNLLLVEEEDRKNDQTTKSGTFSNIVEEIIEGNGKCKQIIKEKTQKNVNCTEIVDECVQENGKCLQVIEDRTETNGRCVQMTEELSYDENSKYKFEEKVEEEEWTKMIGEQTWKMEGHMLENLRRRTSRSVFCANVQQ